jgi:hypothetical protein
MATTALVAVPVSSRTALAPSPAIDATEALGEQIAALAMQLHAATYELLVLLREFDQRTGWHGVFVSCAHWLHWRTGSALGAAREKVRVANALATLPRISATMRRGAISYAKVRALTRVATPASEATLLTFAEAGTAAHVERLVRAWRRVDEATATAQEEARHLHRHLSTWTDDDGMVVIRGRLTPELGAVVQRALDAAGDRLHREEQSAPNPVTLAEQVTQAQRRADALGMLAEAALSANLDRGAAGDCCTSTRHRVWRQGKVRLARWKSATARWTFPRRRRDGSPAMPQWCRCAKAPTARCSTSGARPAPSRPRSAGRFWRATRVAVSRAARPAAATRTTSNIGWTAAKPASTTW